jgi:hypothetical protein
MNILLILKGKLLVGEEHQQGQEVFVGFVNL